jgi:hypothetical protein
MAPLAGSCYGYPRVDRTYRTVRYLLLAACVLALWAAPRRAFAATAAAPICDDRGASLIAPPPLLQAPEDAVRRARWADCGGDESSGLVAIGQGKSPRPPSSSSVEPALPFKPLTLLAPSSRLEIAPDTQESGPRGERARVERPPR